MARKQVRSVLITGASAGIGKEVARQLGLRPEIEKVYLGVRNPDRGLIAKRQLEGATGRKVFDLVQIDVADLASSRKAAEALSAPVDGLLMNASGGYGEPPTSLTSYGATEIVASNVLGHAVLLETLLEQQKLASVAIWVGSESARGASNLGVPRPDFGTNSTAELVSLIDGSWYLAHKFKPFPAYAQAKYLGALWMASEARRHPEVRMLTMSPGGTRGTEASSVMNPVQRFVYDKLIMGGLMRVLGQSHSIDVGAARHIDALFDDQYANGVFYGSMDKKLSGPLVDQGQIFSDLANLTFQDNAYAAVHRFID